MHNLDFAEIKDSAELQFIPDLALNLNNKGQSDVILLDFSKAFDKVPN